MKYLLIIFIILNASTAFTNDDCSKVDRDIRPSKNCLKEYLNLFKPTTKPEEHTWRCYDSRDVDYCIKINLNFPKVYSSEMNYNPGYKENFCIGNKVEYYEYPSTTEAATNDLEKEKYDETIYIYERGGLLTEIMDVDRFIWKVENYIGDKTLQQQVWVRDNIPADHKNCELVE